MLESDSRICLFFERASVELTVSFLHVKESLLYSAFVHNFIFIVMFYDTYNVDSGCIGNDIKNLFLFCTV